MTNLEKGLRVVPLPKHTDEAKDEGKRIACQLWQEAMGNNYQNVSALLDNQSMVSASQVAGGPFDTV